MRKRETLEHLTVLPFRAVAVRLVVGRDAPGVEPLHEVRVHLATRLTRRLVWAPVPVVVGNVLVGVPPKPERQF